MDDWPARAGAGRLFGSDSLTRRLPRLLERSAVRLSICEAMSSAFEARYGLRFRAIANGVEPAVWQALDGERATRRAATEPLLIRYVGGLADDMGLRSLLDVAEVVDKLCKEIGVRLEIHTTRTWKAKADAVFKRSRGVSVHEAGISEEGYRRLLIGCHLLLIAADAETLAEAARRAIERSSRTRSIPWLGLMVQRFVSKVQRGVTKVKRSARALTNRSRAGIVAYLDGHHPDASASLRAALGRLRAYRRVLDRLS